MTTRSVLERSLGEIRDDLVQLGSLVDRAIERAIEALRQRDTALAQQIIDDDTQLNQLRYKIEADCLHIFATQQPMAGDLRGLIAAINIATELERMGDHAEGMSKMLLTDGSDAVGEFVVDLPNMAELCRDMIRSAMGAFLEGDVERARETAAIDDKLDAIYRQMFDDLIALMVRGDIIVTQGMYLLWAAHNLERIGDRVTNICERVEFASTGIMHDMNPQHTGTENS